MRPTVRKWCAMGPGFEQPVKDLGVVMATSASRPFPSATVYARLVLCIAGVCSSSDCVVTPLRGGRASQGGRRHLPSRHGLHVGNVHHQPDPCRVLRIDECPNVGNTEWAEELLTHGRGEVEHMLPHAARPRTTSTRSWVSGRLRRSTSCLSARDRGFDSAVVRWRDRYPQSSQQGGLQLFRRKTI
jgi:hypothetical protein